MLTRKQHDLLVFIDSTLKKNGVAPSFEEMMHAVGLKSKSGVHRLVNALEERGFLKRIENRARAIEVCRMPSEMTTQSKDNVVNFKQAPSPSKTSPFLVPLYGKIAAGTPISAISDISMHVPIPPDLLTRDMDDVYALTIDGDSMIKAGIMDGDTVLIERSNTARDHQIVVALIDDEEATLKRFVKKGTSIELHPENDEHSMQSYSADRVQIQGTLKGLLRQY